MLTQHEKIQPALVRCRAEGLERVTSDGFTSSRFRAVVDDNGTELGHVTGRFAMVQTADVVAAFDLAADAAGFQLEPIRAYYRNGLAKVELRVPNRTIQTSDRDGGAAPRIVLKHGLGGRGGLHVEVGALIQVCTNGMTAFKAFSYEYARHTRKLNVQEMVTAAVSKLDAKIQATELLIAQTQAARATETLMREVLEAAPKRQQDTFAGIIGRNVSTYGATGWALIQSVTELATHHMSERRDGSHVWSADDWSRVLVARVAEAVGAR